MNNENRESRRNLFTPENLIMGVLLSGLTWGGAQIVGIKEVQATLISGQKEDSRVNEIVYESIPQINLAINTISINQKNISDKLDDVDDKISELTVKVNTTTTQLKEMPDRLTGRLLETYEEDPNILGGR